MITSAASRVSEPNPAFVELKRRRGDDNLARLRKLLSSYTPQGVVMLLIGGTDALAFRPRGARADPRNDMAPSWWSHIALVLETSARDIGRSRLVEISLDPAGGFGWAPPDNAVQSGVPLARYRDAGRFPNIAVVDLPPEAPARDTRTASRPRGMEAMARTQRSALPDGPTTLQSTRGTVTLCE